LAQINGLLNGLKSEGIQIHIYTPGPKGHL
jgi:hypothetical protein